MNNNIYAHRMIDLGISQRSIVPILRDRIGCNITPTELSATIRGALDTPKARKIRLALDELLTEMEDKGNAENS